MTNQNVRKLGHISLDIVRNDGMLETCSAFHLRYLELSADELETVADIIAQWHTSIMRVAQSRKSDLADPVEKSSGS